MTAAAASGTGRIPRRVALLLPSLALGGAEKVLIALANHFHARFAAVDMVVQAGGALDAELDPGIPRVFLSATRYRDYARELALWFDQARPDFVLTSVYATGLAALVARILSSHKPRIVVGAHNLFSAKVGKPDNAKDRYLLRPSARLLLPRADAIACVSRGVADDLLGQLRLRRERVHVIHNPVLPANLDALRSQPLAHPWLQDDRPFRTIVTVGRLVPQKGVDALLVAFKELAQELDARLLVVGDGPERPQLEATCAELGLRSHVDFVGADANPFRYLARADLFAMASRWEGFGNTLVEALGCGCRIVATDCRAGPAEILGHGQFGQLVEVDAPRLLARTMRDALLAPRAEADRARAVERSLDFTPDAAGAKYMELLRTLDPWPERVEAAVETPPLPRAARTPVAYVTTHRSGACQGGRAMLGRLTQDVLEALYASELHTFELPRARATGWRALGSTLRGHIDGIDAVTLRELVADLAAKRVATVFIDGSNLGALAAAVRRALPKVRVVVFFHNVEARFFLGSLRSRRSARALAVLCANFVAERQAVRHSHLRICLSSRDSRQLQRIYGRSATHIAPIALHDEFLHAPDAAAADEAFALFVGGTFYANRRGIEWYAAQVASRAGIKVRVIGHGFEVLRPVLEVPGKLEVVGSVDHLGDWYGKARFVVAPVFDGSGMKTKVAEALMHGKRVVGTPEAFSGYEDVATMAGWVCTTGEEFLHAMALADRGTEPTFDPALRELYTRLYSFPAAVARMRSILKD